ncbi:hypothetical protein VIMY103929_20625 [Vibrio mytili]
MKKCIFDQKNMQMGRNFVIYIVRLRDMLLKIYGDLMNLYKDLPHDLGKEMFDELLNYQTLRIERIVSRGHVSPEEGWYDQEEHEWVVIIQGAGEIEFKNGPVKRLEAGDHINIPAHTKHRVNWTTPDKETIWLAVFYQ